MAFKFKTFAAVGADWITGTVGCGQDEKDPTTLKSA